MKIQISTDAKGYLLNPEDWDEKIAIELAREEGIELNEEYWPILRFVRSYYDEHAAAPDVSHVFEHLANEHGYETKHAKTFFFRLFPFGHAKQACKISGMKQPRD